MTTRRSGSANLLRSATGKSGRATSSVMMPTFASRAASVTGMIHEIVAYYADNAPLPRRLEPDHVAHAAAFLCSPLAAAITGTTLHVDHGLHVMAKGLGPNDLNWLGLEQQAVADIA